MKSVVIAVGILLAMVIVGLAQEPRPRQPESSTPPLAKSEAERKILAVLDHMVAAHETSAR